MQAASGRGDLVLMAGDRVSAGSRAVLRHDFLGRPCAWPKGVFTFARLMESPVFFVTCVRTGWNAYEVHFEQAEGDVFDAYVRFLERETCARPDQWHHFHDFFGHA
jgi:predicted LPLAT superfamily acyltransferase